MHLDVFKPTFLIQIEGPQLSLDVTQEITSSVFEDNKEELDVMELTVANNKEPGRLLSPSNGITP